MSWNQQCEDEFIHSEVYNLDRPHWRESCFGNNFGRSVGTGRRRTHKNLFCKSKVSKLHLLLRVDEYVPWLDIPVDNALLMKVSGGQQKLSEDVKRRSSLDRRLILIPLVQPLPKGSMLEDSNFNG